MTNLKSSLRSLLGDDLYLGGTETKKRLTNYNFNYLTASFQPLPDFIIIGAQKAGTTSLYAYMIKHPKIAKAFKKEVHYFDNNFSKSLKWYKRQFPLSAALKKGVITGEASPYYVYHPDVARRIASTIPDVKLIVVLRNPVDRAISHYWHEVKYGTESLSMKEAFKKETERLAGEEKKILLTKNYYSNAHQKYSYIDRGIYVTQIEQYLKYFDREQVLILKSESLFQDAQKILGKVTDFLQIAPYPLPESKPRNSGKYHSETEYEIREELKAYYKPYNKMLYDLIDCDMGW